MTEKQWIALDEVVLWDANPNQGDIGAIISMIRQFGYRWPIGLMDGKVTKAGNHRTQALRMLRDEIVGQDEERWEVFGPCIRIAQDGTWEIEYIDHSDLTEAQSNAFALADNRAVRLGHDNMEQLATLLEAVYHDDNIPIDATGFSAEDLDDIKRELGQFEEVEAPEAQIDRAAELNEHWQVKRGDLWAIGKHRLLCGDSTNESDVKRVIQNDTVGIVTDPPYGINHDTNYTRFTGGLSQSRNFGTAIEGDDRPFDPTPYLKHKEVILWGANVYSNRLPVGTWLVWDKRNNGNEKFMSDGECAWFSNGHGVYIFNHAWDGFIRDSERGKTLHPTQKPVELFKWCLDKMKSEIVFDPYGGSGAMMAACEQLNRQCRMIEIHPPYCAVILERMSDMGLEPELLERLETESS